jgi:hypothetical protein
MSRKFISSTIPCKLLILDSVFKIGECRFCTLMVCVSELTNSMHHIGQCLFQHEMTSVVIDWLTAIK